MTGAGSIPITVAPRVAVWRAVLPEPRRTSTTMSAGPGAGELTGQHGSVPVLHTEQHGAEQAAGRRPTRRGAGGGWGWSRTSTRLTLTVEPEFKSSGGMDELLTIGEVA